MKLTACLSAALLPALAMCSGLRADPPGDTSPSNPYTYVDPEGVPLPAAHEQQQPTAQDAEAMQEQSEQAQRQRNWLLLDYENVERREAQHASNAKESQDIYLQLSQNKELARLADLTPLDPAPSTPLQPRASPSRDGGGLSLRPEALPSTGVITPVVNPWSNVASSAATSYYISPYSAPMPTDLAPMVSYDLTGKVPADSSTPAPDNSKFSTLISPTDTIDLQTPGMVAARDNPNADAPDLSLDSLPDQNQDNAPDRQRAGSPPQLAEAQRAMDVDEMHLELNAKLKVSNPALAKTANLQQKQTDTQPQAKTAPPANEVPMPITQQPQISPVHAPVANPYDILNR